MYRPKKFAFSFVVIFFICGCLQQNFRWMIFLNTDRFLTTTQTAATTTSISSSTPATTTSSSPPSFSSSSVSFEIAQADDIKTVNCGYTKCFVTFADSDQVGYIIAQDNRTWRNDFQLGFDKAWNIASEIQSQVNNSFVSTLLLGPSEQHYKNEEFVNQVNFLMKQMNDEHPNKIRNFTSREPLIIQQSMVVPSPNYFWHYKDKTTKRLSTYLQFIQSYVTDINLFEQNLFRDLEATRHLIDLFPCLCLDFQFLVDYEGRIHHLDLDRCFDDESRRSESHPKAPPHTKEEILNFIDTLIGRYEMAITEAKISS